MEVLPFIFEDLLLSSSANGLPHGGIFFFYYPPPPHDALSLFLILMERKRRRDINPSQSTCAPLFRVAQEATHHFLTTDKVEC